MTLAHKRRVLTVLGPFFIFMALAIAQLPRLTDAQHPLVSYPIVHNDAPSLVPPSASAVPSQTPVLAAWTTPIGKKKILPTIISTFFPTPATPSVPAEASVPALAGLTPSTYGIHQGQIFNWQVSNIADEQGLIDIVWGSSYPASPQSVFNLSYTPYNRIGDAPGTNAPLYDISWFLTNHPDWVVYQCDQTTPAYLPDETNTPLDITNPAVLDFMMQNIIIPELNLGYRGVGFDNLDLANYGAKRCGHFDTGHHWVAQFSGEPHDSAFMSSVVTWAQTMAKMIHSYRSNAAMAINFPYDLTEQNASTQLLYSVDLDTDERGFSFFGSSSAPFYLSDQSWLAYMQSMHRFATSGRGFLIINEEPSSLVTPQQIQWALANYLLVKGNFTYMTITGIQQYGLLLDRPEYHAPIGGALNAMHAVDCSYRREYTNGLALVNPSSSTACQVSFPANLYRDLGGNLVATFTLAPDSGIVLLRNA